LSVVNRLKCPLIKCDTIEGEDTANMHVTVMAQFLRNCP